MHISCIPSGPFVTNAYLCSCSETGEAVLIDPAPDSYEPFVNAIEQKGVSPRMIWLTHSHWDHIADVVPLKNKYDLPIYIHPFDMPNLESPGSDQLPYWIPIEGVVADHQLFDGEKIQFGKYVFEVIHTPGHTPGSVCFFCEKQGVLFSGDTLFRGSIGNLSFPTCVPDQMWPSLDKLATLPHDTRVFPGHGPETTLAEESWLSQAKEIFG